MLSRLGLRKRQEILRKRDKRVFVELDYVWAILRMRYMGVGAVGYSFLIGGKLLYTFVSVSAMQQLLNISVLLGLLFS